jgi:hypothetical protein
MLQQHAQSLIFASQQAIAASPLLGVSSLDSRPLSKRPFFCQIAPVSATLYRRVSYLTFSIGHQGKTGEIRPTTCPSGRSTTISPAAGTTPVKAVILT